MTHENLKSIQLNKFKLTCYLGTKWCLRPGYWIEIPEEITIDSYYFNRYNYDTETKIRIIQTLFNKEKSENRKAKKPWNISILSRGKKT